VSFVHFAFIVSIIIHFTFKVFFSILFSIGSIQARGARFAASLPSVDIDSGLGKITPLLGCITKMT
jgi:hypothetical protein